MKTRLFLIIALLMAFSGMSVNAQSAGNSRPVAKKILFIGDSMTGWLAERLGAYGKQNGFDVATVVWDGSTIKKWGSAPRFSSLVAEQKPDAIFISLGMNDLFETNPGAKYKSTLDAIKGVADKVPIIWVGPPSWPGHNKGEVMNNWLAEQLGPGHFFRSFDLKLPRQSASNPHPTKAGMMTWMDNVVKWIEDNGAISLPGYAKPVREQMSRGKTFIYKRMKERL